MPYDFQTSYPAFQENKKGKDACRQMVFIAIRKLKECNDKMIAEYLGWPINRITPRRGELVISGLVECAGKRKSGERTVNWWREKKVTTDKYTQPDLFKPY